MNDRLFPSDAPVGPDGRYVLYWMVGARRTTFNFALDYASLRARALGRPLLVFEPLRVDYPWASRRLHAFVMDGMRDNAAACAAAGVAYFSYVEPEVGAGKGLLEALAEHACEVVTDEQPGFFQPRMIAAATPRLKVRLTRVDSVGLLPLRAGERAFPTAAVFRRHLQRTLPPFLEQFPTAQPFAGGFSGRAEVPAWIAGRWPSAPGLDHLPIDQSVRETLRGGAGTAHANLADFLETRLRRYGEDRSHPDRDAQSGLSPWLHFGHISSHQIVGSLLERENWHPGKLGKVTGSRAGWWGLSPDTESFLDELVTWRELGQGFCFFQPGDAARYDALPEWARNTLGKHMTDRRPVLYSPEELETARTHDPVWNAAQTELLQTGRMHNYLRMLWGKKVLEWSPTPADALRTLVHLNNKYAVDGRDPNSYSGIMWIFGRFDRAWGPERPIFGTIRYMSSENTVRKLEIKRYLARFGSSHFKLV